MQKKTITTAQVKFKLDVITHYLHHTALELHFPLDQLWYVQIHGTCVYEYHVLVLRTTAVMDHVLVDVPFNPPTHDD